ncbi:hypothetical protein KAR52_01535 [Candidatus Pacearchaeota archaeon]|nr:hypothetical protein [Candidatus Pacearchaeota archaeon]
MEENNLGVHVKTTALERARNKRILGRIVETILFSAFAGIVTGFNIPITSFIALAWIIGEIVLSIKSPEDLVIQYLLC